MAEGFAEQYYSVSHSGVLRGLHFQLPPSDHDKLVYCTAGAAFDVALDLRLGSPEFGRHIGLTLSAEAHNLLYLPRGFAHGFCVTEGPATMVYNTTTPYAPEHDTGILWNSAGIDWPVDTPLVSTRDRNFPALDEFESPFGFEA